MNALEMYKHGDVINGQIHHLALENKNKKVNMTLR